MLDRIHEREFYKRRRRMLPDAKGDAIDDAIRKGDAIDDVIRNAGNIVNILQWGALQVLPSMFRGCCNLPVTTRDAPGLAQAMPRPTPHTPHLTPPPLQPQHTIMLPPTVTHRLRT